MEKFTLTYPAKKPFKNKALAGVVGSGDMEVIYYPSRTTILNIEIETSVSGLKNNWKNLFDRLSDSYDLPAGKMVIHDFGATPGVGKLRIEQCLDTAKKTNSINHTYDTSFIELSAREKAKALLDKDTCRELLGPYDGMSSPWLEEQDIVISADDGMVLAKGTINRIPTVICAIEGIFQGGSMGEVSGAKMAAAIEMAAEDNRNGINTHAVLLMETGGVRLQEANLGLAAIAEIHSAIVDLKRYTNVVGVVTGTVGCFGGMSIAAALCSKLIVTKEARIGLNGPQVIEQEAGIDEYDSRNRPFIWSFTGGEVRYKCGFADAMVTDSLKSVKEEILRQMKDKTIRRTPIEECEYYIKKLLSVDTSKQITPQDVEKLLSIKEG